MKTINLESYETVNQTQAYHDVSEKYSFIPTNRVIGVLEKLNWLPVNIQEKSCRKPEMFGFQKHVVRFRSPNFAPIQKLGDTSPSIILTNSHNRGSAFNLLMGLDRQVCGNGLVVSIGEFINFSVRHIGYTDDKILEAIEALQKGIPEVLDKIEAWSAIKLNDFEMKAYAKSACQLRYDDNDLPNVDRLLMPVRYEDKENNLFNVFNRVQEKLIKGQKSYRSKSIRAIKGIDQNLKLNKALWTLTNEMELLKNNLPGSIETSLNQIESRELVS